MKRFGDRKDGTRIKDIDALHFAVANIYKKRSESEVSFSQVFDLEPVNKYLEKKNAGNPEYKYSLFQIVLAVAFKIMILRPQMNRFIANGEYYQRNNVEVSFTIKKVFSDKGGEGMAKLSGEPTENIDDVNRNLYKCINNVRSDDATDSTDSAVELMTKLPRFVSKTVFAGLRALEKRGHLPESITSGDMNHASCMIANLGSIKLPAGYHHLSEWGTSSMMCVIGEKKEMPFYDKNGKATMKEAVELQLTLDERIADGYYYARTLSLIRKLFEEPELLDLPFETEVDY